MAASVIEGFFHLGHRDRRQMLGKQQKEEEKQAEAAD
jgi:hypothetical protein